MVKIKMKGLMVGPEGKHQPGDVVEMEDERARGLVARGYAEEVGNGAEDEEAFPKPLGRGLYELSDGGKIRGKAKAETAQAALDEDE